MEKTYFYIVILGEADSTNYQKEENLLKSLGTVEKLTERTYGLIVKSETSPILKELREKISGEENYICLVIQITHKVSSSWCLYKTQSTFLSEIFKLLYHETEVEDEQQ